MDAADFVTMVTYRAEERRHRELQEARARPADGWRLPENWSLVVNAGVKCPNCGDFTPSKQIWLLDDGKFELVGAWDAETGADLMTRGRVHPHVWGSFICKGSAQRPVDALTAGISEDAYWTPRDYLWSLGHRCSYTEATKCNTCRLIKSRSEARIDDDEFRRGWICHTCSPQPDIGAFTGFEAMPNLREEIVVVEPEEDEEPTYECSGCGFVFDGNGPYCYDCCCAECVDERRHREWIDENGAEDGCDCDDCEQWRADNEPEEEVEEEREEEANQDGIAF